MSSRNFTGQPTRAFVLIILLVCLLSATAIFFMVRAMIIPPAGPDETTPPTVTTAAPSDTTLPGVTDPAPTTTDAPVSGNTDPITTTSTVAPGTTLPPETTAPLPPPPVTLPRADTPVGDDYFASILFIGDSRTQGLQIATGGYGASFYADRGLASDGISGKRFVVKTNPDGSSSSLTIIEALTAQPHKGHIYVWLGINELGLPVASTFENRFRTQLSALRTACPDADIVVMSILPVGRAASVYGMPSNAEVNARISTYNDILRRLAEETGNYYLDCYSAFADAEGYLPDAYASDGIHLVRDQNIAVCDYIRQHPIPAEYRRIGA